MLLHITHTNVTGITGSIITVESRYETIIFPEAFMIDNAYDDLRCVFWSSLIYIYHLCAVCNIVLGSVIL